MAGIGISASSGALTAMSSNSQSDANTAASGVRAPASRFGIDRFSEPHDTYDENNPPTMFDRPWPRNSRLASMCWPERSATALAMEIDWPRATMVSAKAMPTRSGSTGSSTAGSRKCGQIGGMAPTTATRAGLPAGHQRSKAKASSVAATMPMSMNGQRGRQRRITTETAIVATPTSSAGGSVKAMRDTRCSASASSRCAEGAGRPSRSGSA